MFGKFFDTPDLRELITAMPACPFPPMRECAAWEVIAEDDRADLPALYARMKDTPYPMLWI